MQKQIEELEFLADELQRELRKAPNYIRVVCGRMIRDKIKECKTVAKKLRKYEA